MDFVCLLLSNYLRALLCCDNKGLLNVVEAKKIRYSTERKKGTKTIGMLLNSSST